MGKVIELVPGKSEEYLLLEFEDNCRLWLRGKNDEPPNYEEYFHCFLSVHKVKLRHNLDRPSRSDFVQPEFVDTNSSRNIQYPSDH